MKNIFIGAAALITLPFSAVASELLPYTYARVYCASRAMGMSDDSAIRQAVSESYISSGNPATVWVNGTETTTDVVAAMRQARLLCPQYHF
tara:strand:+ start:1414 stop:1686 length:273 start_codon:yes stop_codon:yes gene_type:complete